MCRKLSPKRHAALGVTKGNWTAHIQGGNITNVYGPANISSAQFIESDIALRPCVLMAQVTYTF